MKTIVSSLFALATVPAFANEIADKISFVLADSSVRQAIELTVGDAQSPGEKSWFKGVVISETPTTCKGDRQTFVLLFGRSITKDGQTQFLKCSQLVHLGGCDSVTGAISDVEKSARCKPVK